jgi:hypothetical protein
VDEIRNITVKMNAAIRSERAQRAAITTVLAVHKRRIFQDGLDADGGRIGTYSTNPIQIPKNKQARNTGKTKFEGGYAEYKTAIGKNPGYVNLQNFGQMMADYGLMQVGQEFGLGYQNPDNYNKSMWLQEKYDKQIFHHSQSEIDLLMNVLMFELNKV